MSKPIRDQKPCFLWWKDESEKCHSQVAAHSKESALTTAESGEKPSCFFDLTVHLMRPGNRSRKPEVVPRLKDQAHFTGNWAFFPPHRQLTVFISFSCFCFPRSKAQRWPSIFSLSCENGWKKVGMVQKGDVNQKMEQYLVFRETLLTSTEILQYQQFPCAPALVGGDTRSRCHSGLFLFLGCPTGCAHCELNAAGTDSVCYENTCKKGFVQNTNKDCLSEFQLSPAIHGSHATGQHPADSYC